MNNAQPPSVSSLCAILALAYRIAHEAPHLQVRDVFAFPVLFVRVKDTINGIIVAFSSEDDYTTYVGMMRRAEVNRHV